MILYIIGFFVAFLVIAQLISRLPGERYAGLQKAIPSAKLKTKPGEEMVENYIEEITGTSFPYFDNILTIALNRDTKLHAQWKIDPKMEQYVKDTYGVDYVGADAGTLRIHHLKPNVHHEDLTVDFDRKEIILNLDAPGETINCEIGIKTPSDGFIPIAQSNDVTFPQ